MLISVVQVKNNFKDVVDKIQNSKNLCDAIELRLDYGAELLDFDFIKNIKQICVQPMIFTLRKKSQGGFYPFTEEQRLKDLEQLCTLQPDFLDLEYDTDLAFIKRVHTLYPKVKLICSYHDFKQTPQNLQAILDAIQQPEFDQYKIATFANQTADSLRMLCFVKKNQGLKLSGICMGELGKPTRILGPVVGNSLNFSTLDEDVTTAPGQVSLVTLSEIYHFKKLNSQTKIYALLGCPVDKSLGHILHNELIRSEGLNAVYVKLNIGSEELPGLLPMLRELKFSGFSVTMPLKEVIVPYLDFVDKSSKDGKEYRAVNTIIVDKEGRLSGANTDGAGAILALKSHLPDLKNKKIVILGAGGAAKAIAQAALQEGALVCILNRTRSRAIECAQELGCEGLGLEALNQLKESGYSVLINTLPLETLSLNKVTKTPPSSSSPTSALKSISIPTSIPTSTQIDACDFIPGTFVMDVVYNPAETQFLQTARSAGCICIPGTEMFIQQALLQAKLWFNHTAQSHITMSKTLNLTKMFLKWEAER